MEREFILPFLGQRSYLHGTTLFDVITQGVPPESSITFKIAKVITSDRILVRTPKVAAEISATLRWQTASGQGALEVVALSPSPSPGRIGYDEAQITGATRIDAAGAEFSAATPYSFIATLIPLFKELLSRKRQANVGGQWMFTRLDLDRLPGTAFLPLRLTLDPASTNVVARCAVEAGQRSKGQLYFSWVRR